MSLLIKAMCRVLIGLVLLLSTLPLLAGQPKVKVADITIKKKQIANIQSVALVSVYGDYLVNKKSVRRLKESQPALEDFINGKVQYLRKKIIKGKMFPFEIIEEEKVLSSPQYEWVIKDGLARIEGVASRGMLHIIGEAIANGQTRRRVVSAIEHSQQQFFVPEGYGVYQIKNHGLLNISTEARIAREAVLQELGGQAVQSVQLNIEAIGLGGNMFGREKGKIIVGIDVALETANGKQPYRASVKVESPKQTIFTVSQSRLIAGERELIASAAIELSEQAWDIAWQALSEQMYKAQQKVFKVKIK